MNYQPRKKIPFRCGNDQIYSSTDLEDSDALHWLELWVGRGVCIGVIRSCLEFLHGIEICTDYEL